MRWFCVALLATSLSTTAQQPASPSFTRAFHDPIYHLSFDYPASWNFSQTDGDLSTFHLDARTAPHRAILRAVTSMSENPFPASTFSGAYVYFSVTPHASGPSCAAQAAPPPSSAQKPPGKPTRIVINDIPFTHGHDEAKAICIVQRDEVYTTRHAGSCYRFDLAINNFCGGEVSSVRYIRPAELDQVRGQLESILSTLHFDPK
ncbi:MAG TPA: hypothetical protein VGU23_09125 [Acidobacteriaceae bacterium]|nr:hypothetical protein [Acidobacteriaceae bacterium]